MIELTVVDGSYRYMCIIMIDKLVRVDALKSGSKLYFSDGSMVEVEENINKIHAQIREYVEVTQRERAKLYVKEEFQELIYETLGRIIDSAWKYEQNSK